MSLNIGDVNTTACVGAMNEFTVNISTAETGLTAFSFNVEVVDSNNIKPSGVMVAHMEVLETGSNVLCSEVNFTTTSTTLNTAVDNSGSMEFNITNFGTMTDLGGNSTITVKVVLVPLPGYAITGDAYKVKIGLTGHTTTMDETTVLDISCENQPDVSGSFKIADPLFFNICGYCAMLFELRVRNWLGRILLRYMYTTIFRGQLCKKKKIYYL